MKATGVQETDQGVVCCSSDFLACAAFHDHAPARQITTWGESPCPPLSGRKVVVCPVEAHRSVRPCFLTCTMISRKSYYYVPVKCVSECVPPGSGYVSNGSLNVLVVRHGVKRSAVSESAPAADAFVAYYKRIGAPRQITPLWQVPDIRSVAPPCARESAIAYQDQAGAVLQQAFLKVCLWNSGMQQTARGYSRH